MKCKRLCAWLLSLVMMFSLLPVSAAAVEHEPTIKWGGLTPLDYTLSVQVYYENKGLQWEKTETEKHLWVDVHPASGTEVYKADSDGGSYLKGTGHFTFGPTKASLKLYTRSTAGHTVTVNYVFKDASGNTKAPVTKSVKYNDTETFELTQDHYDYTIKHESGDATHKVDAFNRLSVTGGAENSVFTVTYTPKKNMAYLDQYYKKEGVIDYPKWNKEHLSFNGPDVLDNNRYEKAYLIQGGHLTELLESARFLDVDGTIYDFTAAKRLPSDLKLDLIDKVWYDREDAKWYYTSSATPNIPAQFTGIVNLYYGEKHTKGSEYHDFVATTTVEPTCTEGGYTDYECRYCGKEGQREYVPSLGGHLWGDYKQDKNTKEKDSQHYQVCQRKGCNATSTPVGCNFVDTSIETGTRHTCKDCGYSYTDEITPTGTPVYVYFKTVHPKDGDVQVKNKSVIYNNNTGANWATLGKLTTTTDVTKANAADIGNEVKTSSNFKKHDSNKDFDLALINKWVELKQDNGAAGYDDAPTWAWHLNGQVNVCKLSYDANLPDGVGEDAVTGMPKPAYYLPDREAPVSKDIPTLQGYNFGGWYTEKACENKVGETVAVSKDTVLYAKWKPITADLIDDDITITHGVDAAPADGDDTAAHIVNKDATISYQATLDMQSLKFGANPEHADTVSLIKTKIGKASLWEFMEAENITTFAGSEVNLHVKFDEKLNVTKGSFDSIELASDWFRLADGYQNGLTKDSNGYWTIPCVIKDVKGTNNSPIITLSGIALSLTEDAQNELRSDKDLDIISEGYIDGTIKISTEILNNIITYELSLIGMSKDAPAKNTAKLKLAVPTYTVTYRGNGADSGETTDNTAYAPGTTATVKENGFTRSRYTFTGWNTEPDGSDKSYAEGVSIKMLGNVVLYAQWARNSSRDDDDDKYFFAIQKVDAQDGHALNDAKFELYQRDNRGNKLAAFRKTTSHWGTESGIALFSVSATKTSDGGSTWYYREITAPEGYVLDRTEHKIKATNFSDTSGTAVQNAVTVRNYRGTTPDLLNDSDHFAYVIGYMDGNVRPYGLISRAETTTIFFRLLKDSVRDGNLLTSNTYTDVADDYWANTAISTMTGLGIVQGRSTTTFDPKAPITRAQFAAICARFDTGKSSGEQTFTDIKGHWAEKYIQRAAELGWIKGFEDGTFRPDTYITRAQAMTMINRVLNRIPEDESDLLPGMNVWPDCNPGDWFYLAVQEATNSHDFEHKAGNYETWTKLMKNPDWTRYEN